MLDAPPSPSSSRATGLSRWRHRHGSTRNRPPIIGRGQDRRARKLCRPGLLEDRIALASKRRRAAGLKAKAASCGQGCPPRLTRPRVDRRQTAAHYARRRLWTQSERGRPAGSRPPSVRQGEGQLQPQPNSRANHIQACAAHARRRRPALAELTASYMRQGANGATRPGPRVDYGKRRANDTLLRLFMLVEPLLHRTLNGLG
jgi:hypothetical protein